VLVDAHLLESVAQDRYRFHDLLRVYAADRAAAEEPAPERDAAVTRLLQWYLRAADAAATAVLPHRYDIPLEPADAGDPSPGFADAEEALSWYDSERANLVTATRQAAASGRPEVAWRLPAPLFIIFISRGNWADCIATHRVALDSARRAGDRRGEAWVLNNLGYALGGTGDPDGIGCLQSSLAIRRETGDRIGEAQAANNLADTYLSLGRTNEALELYRRALEVNREIDRYSEGVSLVNLGTALLDLDRAGEAIGYLQQARDTFAEVDYVDGTGYALHELGRCYLSLRRDAEALSCLREALSCHRAGGNRRGQAATLTSLGTAQSRLGPGRPVACPRRGEPDRAARRPGLRGGRVQVGAADPGRTPGAALYPDPGAGRGNLARRANRAAAQADPEFLVRLLPPAAAAPRRTDRRGAGRRRPGQRRCSRVADGRHHRADERPGRPRRRTRRGPGPRTRPRDARHRPAPAGDRCPRSAPAAFVGYTSNAQRTLR
jgi:tetratricopeptide (TPR) repeat protein